MDLNVVPDPPTFRLNPDASDYTSHQSQMAWDGGSCVPNSLPFLGNKPRDPVQNYTFAQDEANVTRRQRSHIAQSWAERCKQQGQNGEASAGFSPSALFSLQGLPPRWALSTAALRLLLRLAGLVTISFSVPVTDTACRRLFAMEESSRRLHTH